MLCHRRRSSTLRRSPKSSRIPLERTRFLVLVLWTLGFHIGVSALLGCSSEAPQIACFSDVQSTSRPDNTLLVDVRLRSEAVGDAYVLFREVDGQPRWSKALADDSAHVDQAAPAKAPSLRSTLYGLASDTIYEYRVVALDQRCKDSQTQRFETGPLPATVPAFRLETDSEDVLDGYVLINWVPYSGIPEFVHDAIGQFQPLAKKGEESADVKGRKLSLLILDRKGRVVWYHHSPAVFAVYEWSDRGTVIARLDRYGLVEKALGGEIIRELRTPLDVHHDIMDLPDGRLLVLATDIRPVDFSSKGGPEDLSLVGDQLLEMDWTGTARWRWSTYDAFDPLTAILDGKTLWPKSEEWFHTNAIELTKDGDYLLSLHKTNQVVKVDAETRMVSWVLGDAGDFHMEEGSRFLQQHHLTELPNDRLLIFDNGDANRPISRALELEVDEASKTAKTVWEYELPADLFSLIMGGAERMANGNTLLASSTHATVLEVTRDGMEVWRARGPQGLSYRAQFIASLDPDPPPELSRRLDDPGW